MKQQVFFLLKTEFERLKREVSDLIDDLAERKDLTTKHEASN